MIDINLQTKIADLLTAYPQLEDRLIGISPLFAKLQNPILRRTVAKVTSVQQAASIANIAPPTLVQQLREVAGLPVEDMSTAVDSQDSTKNLTWLNIDSIAIRYNAIPVIEAGESPMQKILQLSSQLQSGEILQVSTPFYPAPIIDILRSKGYNVWSNANETYILNAH